MPTVVTLAEHPLSVSNTKRGQHLDCVHDGRRTAAIVLA
jgi:hypothetical protein